MSKEFFIVVLLFITIFSCNNKTKKSQTNEGNSSKIEESIINLQERNIEDALYEGCFIKNENGFDITIKNNTIYMLKIDPSKKDMSTNFFLDIVLQNDSIKNFDLPTSKIHFKDILSKNYENLAVYKFTFPIVDGDYEIIVGQYDNSGRIWTTSVQSNILNQNINNYKNEYANFIKSNKYLKDFESALYDGYFMLYPNGYDLLVNKNIIYFIKPTNQNVDIETRFYLHIKFNNTIEKMILDFDGKEFQVSNMLGPKYENFTVIRREIPSDKKIIEIGAGQFNNEGRLWQVIYDLEKMHDNITYIYDNQYKDYLTPDH